MATIKCTKNLYNGGLCFKKDGEYEVNKVLHNNASLIDSQVINEKGEQHIIGSWWRNFRIIKS